MLEDGNISVMDQTGGSVVPITRDASRMSANAPGNNGVFTLYTLPVWAPDGQQLALVEVTARQPNMTTTIELSPESVTIERGPGSGVVEQGPDGQQEVRQAPPGTRIETRPDVVMIQRGSNSGELLSSAVYVAQADGKRPLRELYLSKKHEIPYLDWSPDSAKLAFLTKETNDEAYAVNLVNATGGKPRTIFTGTSAAWHWNPDGNTLVAKVGETDSKNDSLALFDAQSNTATQTEAKGTQSFIAPSFSPDGNFMLVTMASGQGNAGRNKLMLADRNGKPLKELATFDGSISFSWSPAGAKLAYTVQPPNSEEVGSPLHLVDANSGEDKVLTQQPVVAFFWSPDGTRIATFSRTRPTEIDPNFPGYDVTPPQPRSIFLLQTITVATRAARQLFYFEPTETFRRVTTEFDRYARAINIWSPDSSKLVFTVSYGNGTQSRDFVLETEASGSIDFRVLTFGSLAFWSPK
jgi:Tol biopolymer transport system component